MIIARLLFALLFLAGIGCFGAFMLTGNLRWRQWGLRFVITALALGFAFFAALLLERLSS